MTLRLRHLRLRAQTSAGPYGTDITFGSGLTVIWADNTRGKSTCMQGMLYALGMERMLSPRREIPLPHAMTSFIETDNKERHAVLESAVSLEIENDEGQIVTVHRPVRSKIDNRLINVEFGPTLTTGSAQVSRKSFFVSDPGAATREDGFHYFLEQFLGWELPTVKRYDAPDGKLYLETIFPLFWVEQKVGWSSIPAAIPTYLRIREVHKRAVEFIMDLDVPRLELRRQQVMDDLAANAREWRLRLDEIERVVRRSGGRIEGISSKPTAITLDLDQARLFIAESNDWVPLGNLLTNFRARVGILLEGPLPEVGTAAEQLRLKLEQLTHRTELLNAERLRSYSSKQIKDADIASLKRRIKSLEEDLQKNQDVQKLQRFSGSTVDLTPDRCPTCEQALMDTLLTQEILTAVMPIEDNIEYLRSQLAMFRDVLVREEEALAELTQTVAVADRELIDLYAQIRTLRTDLVSPNSSPSAAVVEERVRLEIRVRELEELQAAVDDLIAQLRTLSESYAKLLAEQASLPADKMSVHDRRKLKKLTSIVCDQAKQFGFSTFDPDEVTISDDTYRPQKEGFEIGFETSASDAIRLKWAYQLGLLELGIIESTNHPGLLVFDEPRQQSSAKVSFERLLKRASAAKQSNRQVIFSTSEDLSNLERILQDLDCNQRIFPGYMIQPLS
ncbi:AAA family ATPase [Bradyrhizobium sp. sBnM-33]|nr:AAA family ATPase [Bradyrhizobium sp. sBnM-33]WOH50558.1 AAA family ATPase [Bradyrhizobium sp. sBnM-33]